MYSKIALTIGGSDSGGGAGIQADLKTFMSLKVHGCSVITCVTAQNSRSVIDVEPISIKTLNNQLKALFSDFKISALKTGMLFNEGIISNTSKRISTYSIPKVIDPVMFTRSGDKLLEDISIDAYKKLLIPQADILTPNIFEANLLSNLDIKDANDVEKAGKNILKYGCKAVLIKGGGLKNLKGKDFFINCDGKRYWLEHEYIETTNTHGSGCTLSAAICSNIALGLDLLESIKRAKSFVEISLRNSYQIGLGPGPLGHMH
mgnify:CR=1 FL=1|tara:strand:- start:9936 stop:10718 length:783 start_codon:yes stop_codon:yes gene_type:complete